MTVGGCGVLVAEEALWKAIVCEAGAGAENLGVAGAVGVCGAACAPFPSTHALNKNSPMAQHRANLMNSLGFFTDCSKVAFVFAVVGIGGASAHAAFPFFLELQLLRACSGWQKQKVGQQAVELARLIQHWKVA